jgi:hypothetical protein
MTADNLQMTAAAAFASARQPHAFFTFITSVPSLSWQTICFYVMKRNSSNAPRLCSAGGNFSIVQSSWPLFTQYADYLVANGLDPTTQVSKKALFVRHFIVFCKISQARLGTNIAKTQQRPIFSQLCSDDFEGPSPHNANLAAKSIVGIAVYAALCDATNRSCGEGYMKVAKNYSRLWVEASVRKPLFFTMPFTKTGSPTINLTPRKVYERAFVITRHVSAGGRVPQRIAARLRPRR